MKLLVWFLNFVLGSSSRLVLPEYPKPKTITWDELLAQGLVGWQLSGHEAFIRWRARIVLARRMNDRIQFVLYQMEVSVKPDVWQLGNPAKTVFLRATPLEKAIGGWRFDINNVGAFLLTPPPAESEAVEHNN